MDANTTKAAISAEILAHIAKGNDLPGAYDAVFGSGAYMNLVDAMCNALRVKPTT